MIRRVLATWFALKGLAQQKKVKNVESGANDLLMRSTIFDKGMIFVRRERALKNSRERERLKI